MKKEMKKKLEAECLKGNERSCIALGQAKALATDDLRSLSSSLRFLLYSFFLTFIVLLTLALINHEIIHSAMDLAWIGWGGHIYTPTVVGWIFIGILIGTLILGVFLGYRGKLRIAYVFMAIAGVFLQLVLNAIVIIAIW